MRRVIATVALCALVFGVAFAGAKVATVTNPMSADLNANSFQIYNAAGYGVNGDETNIGANYVGTHELILSVNPGILDDPLVTIVAGSADPSVTPPGGDAATVYVRRIDATHRELWFKTGTAWSKVTP